MLQAHRFTGWCCQPPSLPLCRSNTQGRTTWCWPTRAAATPCITRPRSRACPSCRASRPPATAASGGRAGRKGVPTWQQRRPLCQRVRGRLALRSLLFRASLSLPLLPRSSTSSSSREYAGLSLWTNQQSMWALCSRATASRCKRRQRGALAGPAGMPPRAGEPHPPGSTRARCGGGCRWLGGRGRGGAAGTAGWLPARAAPACTIRPLPDSSRPAHAPSTRLLLLCRVGVQGLPDANGRSHGVGLGSLEVTAERSAAEMKPTAASLRAL